MKPYGVKIIEWPDVADIKAMGAKSSTGKFGGRGYASGEAKARTRRYWKRKARRAGKSDTEDRAND